MASCVPINPCRVLNHAKSPLVSTPSRLSGAPSFGNRALRIKEPLLKWSQNSHSLHLETGSSKFRCNATLTVKDDMSGTEFPLVQQFWESLDQFRCMGASGRAKKLLGPFNVKVYAITLYLEGEKAAKELKLRSRGDFMESGSDGDFCDVILDGAYNKVLQFHMLRSITPEQFIDAIERRLKPRLQFTGQLAPLQEFSDYIASQELSKGTDLLFFWHVKGFLDIAVVRGEENFGKVVPGKRVDSAALCRALYELFLGEDPVIPKAKATWASGARRLLASKEVL